MSILLSGCVSRTLVKYEPVKKIRSDQDIKRVKNNPRSEFLISREGDLLSIAPVMRFDVTTTWNDIYTREAVWEKRCRGWMATGDANTSYCSFDGASFFAYHVILVGILYDIYIPFQSYGDAVTYKEPIDGEISKEEHSESTIDEPLAIKDISLEIDGQKIDGFVDHNLAKFDLSKVKTKHDPILKLSVINLLVNGTPHNISQLYNDFNEAFLLKRTEKKLQEASAKWREENRPEKKFKMSYCSEEDLFLTAIVPEGYGKQIQSNCMYIIKPSNTTVLQSLQSGVLLSASQEMGAAPFRTVFIEGAMGYVDGERPKEIVVKSTGTFQYVNALGAMRTIRKFKYLGDYIP